MGKGVAGTTGTADVTRPTCSIQLNRRYTARQVRATHEEIIPPSRLWAVSGWRPKVPSMNRLWPVSSYFEGHEGTEIGFCLSGARVIDRLLEEFQQLVEVFLGRQDDDTARPLNPPTV